MSNMNPQIRANTAAVVKNNIGRLILMTLALAGVAVGAMLALGLVMSLCMNIHEALGAIVSIVGVIAIYFVMIGLSLGYTNGLIQMANGLTPAVSVIFSRISKGLPGLGLSLWIGLKVWLWTLPGMGVAFLGTLFGSEVGAIISIIGMILAYVLMIPAAFRYAMSTYYFAENPDNGVFNSVAMSITMMDGRKMQLFCLSIPYILIMIATSVGMSLLTMLFSGMGSFGAILMLLLSVGVIVADIYVSLLMSMAYVCFYTTHRV